MNRWEKIGITPPRKRHRSAKLPRELRIDDGVVRNAAQRTLDTRYETPILVKLTEAARLILPVDETDNAKKLRAAGEWLRRQIENRESEIRGQIDTRRKASAPEPRPSWIAPALCARIESGWSIIQGGTGKGKVHCVNMGELRQILPELFACTCDQAATMLREYLDETNDRLDALERSHRIDGNVASRLQEWLHHDLRIHADGSFALYVELYDRIVVLERLLLRVLGSSLAIETLMSGQDHAFADLSRGPDVSRSHLEVKGIQPKSAREPFTSLEKGESNDHADRI